MTVFLWKHKLSFFSVPKVACTSVKTMLFEVENGRPFQLCVANGRAFHIHRFYPTRGFADLPRSRIADHARFALVRDPVSRFLSNYSNRVLRHRELSPARAGEALAKRDLPPDPDLATFIDLIDDYRSAVDSIRHHTQPMVFFLGRDPGYYAGLYPIERIGALTEDLSARLGRELHMPTLQSEGKKIDSSALSPQQMSVLKQRYEEDYQIYGDWL